MKLGTKFSLTAVSIVILLSILLEGTSILVFSKKIHALNVTLFEEKLDRLVSMAFEQDELVFERTGQDPEVARSYIIDRLETIYRNDKDSITFPFILDEAGQMVVHPVVSRWSNAFRYAWKKEEVVFDKKILNMMLHREAGEFEYGSPDGLRRWCVFKRYQPWGWIFCMTTSKKSLDKTTTSYIGFGILVCVLGIVISSVVMLAFSRRYTRPIYLVIDRLQKIARGEGNSFHDMPINIGGTDEVGMLARAVNTMTENLNIVTVSRNYLDSILESSPLGVFFTDEKGDCTYANHAFERIAGRKEEEVLGRGWSQIIHPEDRENVFKEWVDAAAGRRNYERFLRFIRQDGSVVWIKAHAAPIHEGDRFKGHVGTVEDVTEQKQLEKTVLQSEKMSAVGQLAAGVAHEINNPLGVILGFAQAVSRRMNAGDPLEVPLKSIEREAKRCKDLVQDLLSFSRTSTSEREPSFLNDIVNKSIPLVQSRATVVKVGIKKALVEGLPRISASVSQIQQVIVNLANNALDAMERDGGTLTIKTEFLCVNPQSWVCLCISDTGSGIPAEILPKIFDPFFTTKPVGKGTGLGLSLVYDIVQKHFGTIDVKSQPGYTEFIVKFPATVLAQTKAF